MIDEKHIKQDFPLFTRQINGKPIIYLDSAATSLKPQVVIDAVDSYYKRYSANVFRGIYTISEEATANYEAARARIAGFIHGSAKELVFTRNTTESLNLLAYTLIPSLITSGDTVVTTIMEHHSNFVPWQQLLPRFHGELKVLMTTPDGTIDLSDIERVVTKKTKIFTVLRHHRNTGFNCIFRTQDVGTKRHRLSVGTGSVAHFHAAIPVRRRYDP